MKKIVWNLVLLGLLFSCGDPNEDYLISIETEYGTMYAVLYDETPKHKENFIKLAAEGYYDSILFHRVMQDFMIQTGDPDSKNAQPGASVGTGSPGYQIDSEMLPQYFHKKGALAAARQPDNINPQKKSSGSQFYIVQGKKVSKEEVVTDMDKLNTAVGQLMQFPKYDSVKQVIMKQYQAGDYDGYTQTILALKPEIKKTLDLDVNKKNFPMERVPVYESIGGAPFLDDEYTVFGQVIKGLEIVDKIAAVQVDGRHRPLEDVRIHVKVEKMKKKKITKMTGYEYPVVASEKK